MVEDSVCVTESSLSNESEGARTSHTSSMVSSEDQAATNRPGLVQPKEVVDLTLQFLSTSSNEALLCVFACLLGATFVLFGRLGLLLIGITSGVVLHASWEGADYDSIDKPLKTTGPKRRELALDVAGRLLDWPKRAAHGFDVGQNSFEQISPEDSSVDIDYSTLGPVTAAALRSMTDAVMADYVNSWSRAILPSETTFPLSCRKLLTGFISSLSSHLSRKRPADTLLELLTNTSSLIIVFLNELSAIFESVESSDPPEQVVLRYLETSPGSGLANILAEEQQRKKLNLITDDILSSFLDPNVYGCPLLKNFIREMLASVLFESAISSLSRPEIINGWIIYLLSEGKSEIMTAIDAGVEGAQKQGVAATRFSDNVNYLSSKAVGDAISDSRITGKDIQHESTDVDRATVEAKIEAKRLSDMIAVHELRKQSLEKAIQDNVRKDVDVRDHGENSLPADNKGDEIRFCEQLHGDTGQRHTGNESQPRLEEASGLPQSPHFGNFSPLKASAEPLTLYGASITVETDSDVTGKGLLRSKPTSSYLIQIEPISARSTGWMVFRKYDDFEPLHETLEAISRLHKIRTFAEDHPIVPLWKGQTNSDLAKNLERYLQGALCHQSLAESERMKRFLGKDEHLGSESTKPFSKAGFPFPSQTALGNVGKGVLGVLTSAPKGVSEGGKAVLEGVTGVFGGAISKKPSPDLVADDRVSPFDFFPHQNEPINLGSPEEFEDSARTATALGSKCPTQDQPPSPKIIDKPDLLVEETSSEATKFTKDLSMLMPESSVQTAKSEPMTPSHAPSSPGHNNPTDLPRALNGKQQVSHAGKGQVPGAGLSDLKSQTSPITQEETRIAVELIFAVINELFTLSSAWNIRRTLLNAAKSYILRPGNPHLETIRVLLQESVIDSHTSDEAIGLYLNKLRENSLPTRTELENWPSPPDDVEKERLRETARKAFIQRGLPQALTSVMGANASKEALGKVFDCLQVEIVARGFVFSLILQGLKAAIL
ncbi:PX domain protein [Aspergillus ibericus CBS 121593]|uniref:PX domain protein n=1 Tax=Aspergillus ibericus CBS 121593 TaxID=1448316 RepID=A0A395HER0_9EURO|nr:PX domain protein [Aspergillus ibericus CBS 121593]RAL06220.1 PX domain protein [Aspergillus ibericus CBS 121593]